MNQIMLQLAQDAQPAGADDMYLILGFVLLGVAIAMLVIELFVPSGGLIGVVAGIAAIGSLASFFRYDTVWGSVFTAIYVILGPIAIIYFFKWWINSPFSRRIILNTTLDGESADDEESAAYERERRRLARIDELRGLIGAEGVTETALRPVGTVTIQGERVEALAESGAIDAGVPVVVSDVYDNQIKVRPQ